MTEHTEIYLEAVRSEGDDRMWCEDNVFDDSSRYVLAIPIETENRRLHQALERQCCNMAFILNNADIPPSWYNKFVEELKADSEVLKQPNIQDK